MFNLMQFTTLYNNAALLHVITHYSFNAVSIQHKCIAYVQKNLFLLFFLCRKKSKDE